MRSRRLFHKTLGIITVFYLFLSLFILLPAGQARADDIPELVKSGKKSKCGYTWVATTYKHYEKNEKGKWVKSDQRKDQFDKKGRIKKSVRKYFDYTDNTTVTEITKYKYNKKGLLESKSRYGADGKTLEGRYVYKYTKKGLERKTSYYNSENNLEWKRTTKYTKSGQPATITTKYSDGSIKRITNTYNKKGKLKKRVIKDSYYTETIKYKYSKGRLVREVRSYVDSENYVISGKTEYKYDKKGRLTERIYTSNGDYSKEKYVTKYNKKGYIRKISDKYHYYPHDGEEEYSSSWSTKYSYKYFRKRYVKESLAKSGGTGISKKKYSSFRKIPVKYADYVDDF